MAKSKALHSVKLSYINKLKKMPSCPELSSHGMHEISHYKVGGILKLRVRLPSWPATRSKIVRAEILRCFLPCTLSAVMLVSIWHPPCGLRGKFILKLYDRRFVQNDREKKTSQWWSEDVELKYRSYTFSDKHHQFYKKLVASETAWGFVDEEDEEDDDDPENWTEGQRETEIQKHCNDFYISEFECYSRMKHIQGISIPRLVARVELTEYYTSNHCSPASAEGCHSKGPGCFGVTQGLLLQYIPDAFTLNDISESKSPAPSDAWQYIVEDAIRIVNTIMAQGILNKDYSVRNSLVRWDPLSQKYKVFLIDFGNCEFQQAQSNRDWRERQAHLDEEGAIAVVMESKLKKRGLGGFTYEQSEYARQLSWDFMGEHGPRI